MAKVYLIPCVKEKLDTPAEAQDLYISDFFRNNLEYARDQDADIIFILSGKYGLLQLTDKVEPYDVNLHNRTEAYRKQWSDLVLEKLNRLADTDNDEFVIMADAVYRERLMPAIKNVKVIELT